MNASHTLDPAAERTQRAIERYYRLHSLIYDATRWSFLFGRDAILDCLPSTARPRRILEVGCGTGRNLVRLARRFPQSMVTGLDVAAPMLDIAKKKAQAYGRRISLVQRPYEAPIGEGKGFDLILFSYALSMFNPGWDGAIRAACQDLAPGGHLAVVDFHNSRHTAFRKWMGVNHVRMEGHLQPLLRSECQPVVEETRSAYRGVWEYLLYVGVKHSA